MTKKRGLVYGVGHSGDKPIVDSSGKQLLSNVTWVSMLKRCFNPNESQKLSYKGCSVSEDWLHFEVFKEWFDSNYIKGFHLDKDILIKGNKVYGPDTCLFVSPIVNLFFASTKSKSSLLPVGVFKTRRKKSPYGSRIKRKTSTDDGSKYTYLGTFATIEEADLSYKKSKYEEACLLATLQTDKRISKSLILRFKVQ